jgi:hypothetical protein
MHEPKRYWYSDHNNIVAEVFELSFLKEFQMAENAILRKRAVKMTGNIY